MAGQRASGTQPRTTAPKLTWVLGLGLRGIVAPLLFKGAMNRDLFGHYVRTQLAPLAHRGDIVLADHLPAHHCAEASKAIAERGAKFFLLPPYSPDFSPVEECGAKLKAVLRTEQPRTVADVIDALGRGIARVTPKDALGWFRHRASYLFDSS